MTSLFSNWISGLFYVLHSRLIGDIQAGRADLAYASTVALVRHVRRYDRFPTVAC